MVNAAAIPAEVRRHNGLISLIRSQRLFFTGMPLNGLESNLVLTSAVLLLACTFFTFGYDGGVINGVLALPGFRVMISPKTRYLSASDISLIVGVPNVGVIAGLPLSTFLADRYGRRWALIVTAGISAIAGALQAAAFNFATFVVGRVIASMSPMLL